MEDQEVPEFRIDQLSSASGAAGAWRFVTLFKESITGAMLQWQIGFDGVDHLESSHGHVPNFRSTYREVIPVGNRSMEQQALQEASREYLDKIKEGYVPAGSSVPAITQCMTANKYKESLIERWPVAVQVKIDGIRILVHQSGQGILYLTRLKTNYTHVGHLDKEVRCLLQYLPPRAILDGELYIHGEQFTALTSIVKSIVNLHPRIDEVCYYLFDIDIDEVYEERYNMLINAYSRCVEQGVNFQRVFLVRSLLAHSHQEIQEHHDTFVQQGYEGLMVKKMGGSSERARSQAMYKRGRTSNILKYKNFQDEEGEIISLKEAQGTEKGCAILVVLDPRGNEVSVRMRGSFERRREWLRHPETIVGKLLTYRFQELSQYGVPRFPVGIAFRDYE